MTNLIAELEQAAEGSRELDAKIAIAVWPVLATYADDLARGPGHWISPKDGPTYAEHYTTSLDAARGLSNWVLLLASDIGADGLAWVRLGNPETSEEVSGIHARLEMAWCIAALKARQADE